MGLYIFNVFLSITNKIQSYTTFFITVNALHVSGGSSDAVCTVFELLMMGGETS